MLLSLIALFQNSLVEPGAELRVVADGFGFTEGTVEDSRGDVFFTDQPNDRIMEYTVGGRIIDWMQPCGRANGMWFDRRGRLILCADEHNQLWARFKNQTTVLLSGYNGKLLNGPNDVWIRKDGGMYITDPLYPRPYWKRNPASQLEGNYVFYLSPDGKDLTPVATDLKVPNGIIGTPDGKWLYVGDLGANVTYRYRITEQGALADKTVFCRLGSDGMAMDAKGDVYLTGKGVTVFDPSGQKLMEIPVPQPWVGHVCFGGRNHDVLFIAASKGLYSLQMRVRGAF